MNFPMGNGDLIGTVETCKILGIHESTLVRRIAAGRIKPAGKLPGLTGAYVFERGEVERHRDEQAAKAAAS